MIKTTLNEITLTLMFTYGVGLETWFNNGSINRELELYKRLSKLLKSINFITFGGERDKSYIKLIDKINLIPLNNFSIHNLSLAQLLLKHSKEIRNTDIFKTNQIPGSDLAVFLKKKYKKKLITRCGYLYSYFVKQQTNDKNIIKKAEKLEKNAFLNADMGVVTSLWQKNYLVSNYNLNPDKIRIIPNYVLTDVFKPLNNIKKIYDLVTLGRLDRQKNIEGLLKSLIYLKSKNRNISLLLIGGCVNDINIKKIIEKNGLNVTFLEKVSNFNLPKYFNQAKIFILPSFYEGHPKALLEAMSCQMAVIGTNVNGIRDEIKNMENGVLCNTDYKSIAFAISTILDNINLQKNISIYARRHITKNYSIDKILKLEINAIKSLINN